MPVVLDVMPWLGIRDPFSMISHAIGVVLSLGGMVLVLRRARQQGRDVWAQGSLVVYSISMALAFVASALFHTFTGPSEHLVLYKKLDHAAIFLMIAGTGTAVFGGLAMPRVQKAAFIAGLWVVSLAALTIKMLVWPMPLWLTATIYLVVGWTAAIGLFIAANTMGWRRLRLFVWSGAMFTLGALVFAAEWPILWPGVIEGHEVFHVLVLVATGLMYWFIYTYCTIPGGACDLLADTPPAESLTTPNLALDTQPIRVDG